MHGYFNRLMVRALAETAIRIDHGAVAYIDMRAEVFHAPHEQMRVTLEILTDFAVLVEHVYCNVVPRRSARRACRHRSRRSAICNLSARHIFVLRIGVPAFLRCPGC